jgi:hypothetical protein
VKPVPLAELPPEMTAEWQLVDLTAGNRDYKMLVSPPPGDKNFEVAFAGVSLNNLRIGLMAAGLDPSYFPWPPESDPDRPPYRGLLPLEADDAGIFFGREGFIVLGLEALWPLSQHAIALNPA